MRGVSVGGWGGEEVGGEGGGGRRGLKTAEILLAESCRKQVSFESGFKFSQISQSGSASSLWPKQIRVIIDKCQFCLFCQSF